MDYLLLAFSCFCNGMKSVYAKKSNDCLTDSHNIYTYNFYMCVISFFLSLFIGIPGWNGVSFPTVIMAVLYGVLLIFAQFLLIKTMEHGSVSISMLFYSCGFLVPIFTSMFIYNEIISYIQWIGVALIIVSFVITVEKDRSTSLKWFFLAVSALLCNGTVGTIQKVFRMSEFKAEQSAFTMIVFLAGSIFAFLLMPKKFKLPSKKFLQTVSVSGLSLGLTNIINVYVSGVLPGVIVFPSVNGGGIIISAFLAKLMLKEKISLRKKRAVAVGIIAICLIAL